MREAKRSRLGAVLESKPSPSPRDRPRPSITLVMGDQAVIKLSAKAGVGGGAMLLVLASPYTPTLAAPTGSPVTAAGQKRAGKLTHPRGDDQCEPARALEG